MSDLVGNPKTGFLTTRLKFLSNEHRRVKACRFRPGDTQTGMQLQKLDGIFFK